MKKIFAIVLAALMAAALLAGCGSGRPTAQKALTEALDALQKCDRETAQKYFSNEDVLGAVTDSEEEGVSSEAVVKTLFSGLAYEVTEVKEDGDTASATVTLTNKDMQQVITAFLQKLFTEALREVGSGAELTDELYAQYFQDCYNQTSGTVSNTVTLQMNYTAEDGWKIAADTDFADAVSGGFVTAMSQLQSALNS